jgi:hypothetical protein
VQQLGFKLFGATLWKLLIIESFKKSKLKIVLEFGAFLVFRRAFNESNLINFTSQIS